MNGSSVFTVMVVGENPNELINQYELDKEVEPYVVYKYKDAEKMRKNSIKIFEGIIKDPKKFNLSNNNIDIIKDNLKKIKSMTNFEYYKNLVSGYFINDDGDAISTLNPNGKWQTCKIAKNMAVPLKLYDGSETFSNVNENIDWSVMHMYNTHTYESVWELVVEGREPKDDVEKLLFNNMNDKMNYFKRFKNKEEYVTHNCAYWNYAYLDKNGWIDMDDAKNDIEWISNYYEKFITKLEPNDKITIFECTKGKMDF